jgi:Tol biopolymer transport system component
VTATPTSPFAALSQITPQPTPTALTLRMQALQTPIPPESGLLGNIVFYTDREPGLAPQIWVMDPKGTVIGKMTGDLYYRLAENRELFSPDRLLQVDAGRGNRAVWNIVILDVAKGILSPLIPEDPRGRVGAYHPAWSPLGDKIAYVSDGSGADEIYVYDVTTKASKRLTTTLQDPGTYYIASNKHPSWSPDGGYIIFSSDRDADPARKQIWIMNADGSNLRVLSPSPYNDWDPIWVKK